MLQPVPDHIREGLDILFIGFNPSIRSSEVGHHYANPNNRFWMLLYESGLTARKYKAEEDFTLLNSGFGFTNIVARPTKEAKEITKAEYKEGRRILLEKLQLYRPKIACYVGKQVYVEFSGRRNISWGMQSESVVNGVVDFVTPSSSGLVRMKKEEIVCIFRTLKELLETIALKC